MAVKGEGENNTRSAKLQKKNTTKVIKYLNFTYIILENETRVFLKSTTATRESSSSSNNNNNNNR
jgi:hypothetical protein